VLWVFACAVLAGGLTALILWYRNRQKAKQVWRQEVDDLERNRQGLVESKNQVSFNTGIAQVQVDTLRSQRDHLWASNGNLALEQAKERHQQAKKEVERIDLELQALERILLPIEEAQENVESAKEAVSRSRQEREETRNAVTNAQRHVEIME